jgi:hypothetical protein
MDRQLRNRYEAINSARAFLVRPLHTSGFLTIVNVMRPPLQQRQVKTTPPTNSDAAPRLPHEQDESEDSQASAPREIMQQAHDDLERGLVDTDLRGSLGVDEATRAPHNNPEATPVDSSRARDPNSQKLPDGK